MKKTWFFAVLSIIFCTNVFAMRACPSHMTEYEGLQDPDDDEFLYPTVSAWSTAYEAYYEEKLDAVNITIYECDNDYCFNGQRVILEGSHYHNGQEKSGLTMYTCHSGGGDQDYWTSYALSDCTDFSDKWKKITAINETNRECYSYSGLYCCLSEEAQACFAAKQRGEPANWNGTSCNCGDKHIWSKSQKKCIQNAPNKDNTEPVQPAPQPRKTCREQRTTPNGKACCDTSSLGKYNAATDTCECKNGMTFVIENNKGYCRPSNTTPGTKYDCDATLLAQIANINSAYSQLTAIHNKFRDEKSVWKDKDGNFNTARLASDSIAGVVLGTAGGLITSNVVKKNQVENGFEDIKCTIGGQNVAEWGDQFRVGIQ